MKIGKKDGESEQKEWRLLNAIADTRSCVSLASQHD